MKNILKIFILLFFSFSAINANEIIKIKEISLKKDQVEKIVVKYGTIEKLLKFRWTLYANHGLVVLCSYDKIVSQKLLYLRYKHQSFLVDLKLRAIRNTKAPYLLVKFKEFNHEKNEAIFELFMSDEQKEILLKYLNDKEE